MKKAPSRPKSLSRFFSPGRRRLHQGIFFISVMMAVGFLCTAAIWTPPFNGAFYRALLIVAMYQTAITAGLCIMGQLHARVGSRAQLIEAHRRWVFAGAFLHTLVGPTIMAVVALLLWPHRNEPNGLVLLCWPALYAAYEFVHSFLPRGPASTALRIWARDRR